MTFKRIKPSVRLKGRLNGWRDDKPSLYRACVTGNRKEYIECEAEIIAAYNKANKQEGLCGTKD